MNSLFLIPLFALMIISAVPAFASEPTPPETIPVCSPVTVLIDGVCASSIDAKSWQDDVIIGQLTDVNVTFFNPQTRDGQEHVDYKINISKSSGDSIYDTSIMHTSSAAVNFQVTFPESDTYTMDVTVVGILFQPIPDQSFSFEIIVAKSTITPEIEPVPKLKQNSIDNLEWKISNWENKLDQLNLTIGIIEEKLEIAYEKNNTSKIVILEENLADRIALSIIFVHLVNDLERLIDAFS